MEIDQKGLDFEILKREPTSTSGRIEGETVTVEHGKTFELDDRTREIMKQVLDDPRFSEFSEEWRKVIRTDIKLCYDDMKARGIASDRALAAIAFIVAANQTV